MIIDSLGGRMTYRVGINPPRRGKIIKRDLNGKAVLATVDIRCEIQVSIDTIQGGYRLDKTFTIYFTGVLSVEFDMLLKRRELVS